MAEQVLRLRPEEAGRADECLELRPVRPAPGLRVGIAAEERRGHHVDPHIGALGREDGRDQELEPVAMMQRTGDVGIQLLESTNHPRACRLSSGFAGVAGHGRKPFRRVHRVVVRRGAPRAGRRDRNGLVCPVKSTQPPPCRSRTGDYNTVVVRVDDHSDQDAQHYPPFFSDLPMDMDGDHDLRDFSNVCRLFPLPKVVLFPHAVLPLHIFEPRYRQMTEDALAGNKLVTIVQCAAPYPRRRASSPSRRYRLPGPDPPA